MLESTAAKGLSALVYSTAQSKTLFKTHGEKPKGAHTALSLSRHARICSTVICGEGGTLS